MVNKLNAILKTEVKELLSLSKCNQIITAISNLFQYCSSEYNLLNWLTTNDLISEVQQFTKNIEQMTLMMMQKTLQLKCRHKCRIDKCQLRSIKEHSSRYQVSLLYSTDIGRYINKTADDFTKSLIVKRSNIHASNFIFPFSTLIKKGKFKNGTCVSIISKNTRD